MPDRTTTALDVEHLCTVRFETTAEPMVVVGDRVIVTAGGGTFEGERLRGTVHPPGGDWATQRTDGTLAVDVRSRWRTDDGVELLVTYLGIARPVAGGLDIRTAPRFEVGDDRYRWLASAHVVGFGRLEEPGVVYELFTIA